MVSLAITIGAIVPMIAIVSLSAYLYKWEQQHLSAENLATDYSTHVGKQYILKLAFETWMRCP